MSAIRALPLLLLIGLLGGSLAVIAPPGTAAAATLAVSIFGVDGDDGVGNPNPACTGSASCAYNPNPTNISTGDSLNFTNVGGQTHTATGPLDFAPTTATIKQPGTGGCPSDASGNCFSTGALNPGQNKVIGPFPGPSAFQYYCLFHGPSLMIANLNVSGGATTTTTTTTAATTTTTAATTTTTTAPSTTTTTTTAPSTTTTAASTTTTTTTAPSTTTTAATTTTTSGTTTTTGTCTHNVALVLPDQPPQPQFSQFGIQAAKPVNPVVQVINSGTCSESVRVVLSGPVTYVDAETGSVGPGGSILVTFAAYSTPTPATSVTFTASGTSLSGGPNPASTSRTYPTVL